MGPFSKVPTRTEKQEEAIPAGYRQHPCIGLLLELVDGSRSIDKLIDVSSYTALETCAAIKQLHRTRVIDL